MSDADWPASLPQLKEMAKGIAMAVADEADFNEWSRLWYIDDDDEVDSYSREKVVRQIAIRAKPVLAPIYAELERVKAENGQLRAANARFCAETAEKDATIDRMTKLLVECRGYVQNVDIGYLQPIITDLLTRIDKETGGK